MNANHIKSTGAARFFAAVMLIITLLFAINIPAFAEGGGVTYAAKIGDTEYSTLDEAFVCAVDGDVITLLEDCIIYGALTIEKDITLDLAGFTVTVKAVGDAITVLSKLTVSGNGNLVCLESDLLTVGSDDLSGELIINGGNLVGHNSVVTVVNGNALINGGDFTVTSTDISGENSSYMKLLCVEKSEAEGAFAEISVNGGVFHGFNPDGEVINFIGDGACRTVESEGSYTVVPHSYTEYTYNDDANCAHNGTETAKCDYCDATDTVSVPGTKLPSHTFKYFKCEVCGYVQLTLLGYAALGIVVFTILFFLCGISKLAH